MELISYLVKWSKFLLKIEMSFMSERMFTSGEVYGFKLSRKFA